MSRRGRALLFVLLAAAAAAIAAGLANSYGSSIARGYGRLRPVVVISADIRRGQRIDQKVIGSSLTIRRVPERFIPSGTFAFPQEALGLVAEATLPVGSYLLAPQLRPPGQAHSITPGLSRGRRPVELSVSGAGALLATGPAPAGAKVDVVVTSEPGGSGRGRTYIADSRCRCAAAGFEAGKRRPGQRARRRNAGPHQAAGPAVDCCRKLRPQGDPAAGAVI
jgi:Flp pilus assembly protein CpaB